MAVLIVGVKYQCDVCGIDASTGDRYPADGFRYDQAPMPEGWADLGLFNLMYTDPMGTAVRHLCYSCSGLSIGGLSARLKARAAREGTRM